MIHIGTNTRSIMIGMVAGERSGDILGAGLIKSLKKYFKKVFFFGIGGPGMQSENMECWYDAKELSVMGIMEVASKLLRILNIRRNLINRFLQLKIDVFIGIDCPDFNIVLEKHLKNKGVYTIHYVSPSIWAWRKSRVFDLKKATNNILVLFPFEKSIYDCFNIPCQYVGHALADQIPLNPDKNLMRRKLGISDKINCLALLPGSRIQEIQRLTNNFLMSAELLNCNIPNLEVLVPFCDLKLLDLFITIAPSTSVKTRIIYTQKAWEVMVASDVALLASGTATLECMLAKCPMVVGYQMHPITFFLIKFFIKTSWISLPNLLSNCYLVEEFIQKDCTPSNLAQTLTKLFDCNNEQRRILQHKFYKLHKTIKLDANNTVARIVVDAVKI